MLLCLLSLLLSAPEANDSIKVIKTFQNPIDVSDDEYLQFPYSFDFSADGRLYICDRYRSRVMVWNEDGTFRGGYLDKGNGPGQIFFPFKIAVHGDYVYVWSPTRQINIFDLELKDVKIVKVPGPQPRVLAPLKDGLILIGHHQFSSDGLPQMMAQTVNWEGETSLVKQWSNSFWIDAKPNVMTVKAYGPEIDIQRDSSGAVYLGFSEEKAIYQIDENGKIASEKSFDVPTGPPTPMEVEVVENTWFPRADGQSLNLVENPGFNVKFDHQKAYWTHFMIKGGKILFVRTMIGSHLGLGSGFSQGTYYIFDFDTGKFQSQGKFAYPEGSQILFRNGRILGVIVDDEDELGLQELVIKGFND